MSQPTATFQLRPFALSDADSVAPWLTGPGLSLPLGSTAWPERILRDQRILALVGWAGDERLGLLRLDCGPDGVADVTIVVSPEHRRSGFGRRMFHLALSQAEDVGMHSLVAYVDLCNSPALAFFESVGFEGRGVSADRLRMERGVHAPGSP
ncbi:MAG: hypothetical protein CMJ88_09160 [Planctomycetes bacterium]|nr:hypothetical protein [Planctomycetota bacterium]